MTGDREEKLDKKSIDKKPTNPDGKLGRKIDALFKKRYLKKRSSIKNLLTWGEF